MTALHIIHRDLPVIDFLFFRQKIGGVGLLQKCIALILFICQDTFHSAAVPFVLSGGSFNSPLGESLRNGMRCQSGQKQAVNFTHDFCLENHVKKDAIGNHKAQWEEVFSLWASVTVSNTVGGAAEETNTGVTRAIQKIEVIIRQTPQTKRMASTMYRIRFDGLDYDIKGIVPNFQTQDYMKLICESRKAGAKDDIY